MPIAKFRNTTFSKFLWLMMGLYFLNISVNTEDPNPEYLPENLNINDQESLIEILVEIGLGYEKAIDEYDDHNLEDNKKKSIVKIVLALNQNLASKVTSSFVNSEKQKFFNRNSSLCKNLINYPEASLEVFRIV